MHTRSNGHTPSNTHSFHHKMAASEKEWGSEVLHYATVVILHFNGTPSSFPFTPLSSQLVILVCRRQAGSKQVAASPQEDWATQLQYNISWERHLHTTAFECDSQRGVREETRNDCVCVHIMESESKAAVRICIVWTFNDTKRYEHTHKKSAINMHPSIYFSWDHINPL